MHVSCQWNEQAFGDEQQLHYPSIVQVVRLSRRGGHLLWKIGVEFSLFGDLSTVLKFKRLLLSEDNPASAVELERTFD